MQIANSGLPRPIHCRDGQVRRVDATGIPLGLFENAEYEELTIQAVPGDVFVFYSDGISDAPNRAGQFLGDKRIEQVVATHCRSSAEEMVKAIFVVVAWLSDGVTHFDDATVVVLNVNG